MVGTSGEGQRTPVVCPHGDPRQGTEGTQPHCPHAILLGLLAPVGCLEEDLEISGEGQGTLLPSSHGHCPCRDVPGKLLSQQRPPALH